MQRAEKIFWMCVDVKLGWPILSYWSGDLRLTTATGLDENGRRPENGNSRSRQSCPTQVTLQPRDVHQVFGFKF